MLNHSLVLAIASYQKHISPRKGFHCAYRLRQGGASCSEYAKQAVLAYGIWGAIPAIRQRFRECKAAASFATASGRQNRGQNREQRRNRRDDSHGILDYCDCCSGIDLIPSESCGALGGGADACSCTPW